MNQHRTDLPPSAPGVLTPLEQGEFEFIIANAKSSGWINATDDLTAQRSTSEIVVRCSHGSKQRERCYRDGQRWLYELLHDLAHGMWR